MLDPYEMLAQVTGESWRKLGMFIYLDLEGVGGVLLGGPGLRGW